MPDKNGVHLCWFENLVAVYVLIHVLDILYVFISVLADLAIGLCIDIPLLGVLTKLSTVNQA